MTGEASLRTMDSTNRQQRHHFSDNFLHPTNNINSRFSLTKEGASPSTSSLSKLIDCPNVCDTFLSNYEEPKSTDSSSVCMNHGQKEQQESVSEVYILSELKSDEKDSSELTRHKVNMNSYEWPVQGSADDNKTNYLLSLSPKKAPLSQTSSPIKVENHGVTGGNDGGVMEHQSDSISSNSVVRTKEMDDDQRDPLAKLISSTIGDLMLDIAPAKN